MDITRMPSGIVSQIVSDLREIKSASKIIIKCNCGNLSTMTYRSLYRKWSDKEQYLCKSCHVKTYSSRPDRLKKFKASFSKISTSDEYRAKCSKAGKKAWQDQEKSVIIKSKISQDNLANPAKAIARSKANATLQAKQWYEDHMVRMRAKALLVTKLDGKDFIAKSRMIHGDKYNYSKVEYNNNVTNVTIICPTHGEFNQMPHSHLQGKGCRKCIVNISKEHKIVLDMITTDVIVNDNEMLKPYEIDIYVPSFKLGIEINGEYWHGVNKSHNQNDRPNIKNRHQHKATMATGKGIRLFQFWAHEINQKPSLVQSMINHALGLSQKIYARKCAIERDVDFKAFFDANHMQGYRPATYQTALAYNGEVYAALSLSRHARYQWEIIRYACKSGHTVVGGFQKLLHKFIADIRPTTIMTFADRRISQNNLYQTAGFTFIKVTDPNYFYIRSNTILSRQQCQKHKLNKLLPNFRPELSETENMLANNYSKVYDAGHYQSILSIDKST